MDTMFFENRSKYGFEETINQLQSWCLKMSGKIIQILDLQETMRKNGKTYSCKGGRDVKARLCLSVAI